MTAEQPRLTDALLKRALSELAAGPDASALIDEVLQTVDGTAQAGAPLLSGQRYGTRRLALLAATLLLLATLVGAAALLSGRIPAPEVLPEPIPVPDTAIFPGFTYRIPPGIGLDLSVPRRNELHFDVVEPDVLPRRGVVVVSIRPGLVAHGCDGDRIQVSEGSPAELVDDLRERAGFGLGSTAPMTVDGLPAVVTDLAFEDAACPMGDLHLRATTGGLVGDGLMLEDGARILVVDAHGTLVAIEIWTASRDNMDSWLPTALEFVNSIHFTSDEAD